MWARAFLGLTLAAGCTTAASPDAARLSRELTEMRRLTDSDRHAMHELENRVFILEDKLDTAQVALDKTDSIPRLPVVTKRAPPPEPTPDTVAADPPEPAEEEIPVDEGDDRPSIVIRMDGSSGSSSVPSPSPTPRRPRTTALPADLAAINERLPVVPMPKRGATATLPAPAPAPSSTGGNDAMSAYQTSYQALQRREHAVAIQGFRGFLERFPNHDYADNAQYWLGEAYYDRADFQTALTEFRALLKRYPTGNKAPDALLKVGFCMSRLGDPAGARDVLAQVVDIYPKTDAARLATLKLAELAARKS